MATVVYGKTASPWHSWSQPLCQLSEDRVIVTLLPITSCFRISGWQVYLLQSSFRATSVTLATSARAIGREEDATANISRRENSSLKERMILLPASRHNIHGFQWLWTLWSFITPSKCFVVDLCLLKKQWVSNILNFITLSHIFKLSQSAQGGFPQLSVPRCF